METPRDRRLRLERERMNALVEGNRKITYDAEGARPIEYRVKLHGRGIESVEDGTIMYRDEHHVLIRLTPEFPLDSPVVVWVTKLYHPNIVPPRACLGDHWYPGWSIAQMCEALYEMAVYNTFNIYDPLNKEAAKWVEERMDRGETISLDNPASADGSDFDIKVAHRTD